jgi:hypothetical protein
MAFFNAFSGGSSYKPAVKSEIFLYSGFVYSPFPRETMWHISTFLYASAFFTIASTSTGGSATQCAKATLSPDLMLFTASSAVHSLLL